MPGLLYNKYKDVDWLNYDGSLTRWEYDLMYGGFVDRFTELIYHKYTHYVEYLFDFYRNLDRKYDYLFDKGLNKSEYERIDFHTYSIVVESSVVGGLMGNTDKYNCLTFIGGHQMIVYIDPEGIEYWEIDSRTLLYSYAEIYRITF